MQMTRNKTMATFIAIILVASLALGMSSLTNVKGANTYPIPGHPTDGYDLATYTAIQQGMYWTGMDANASSTRILLWSRFQDQILTHVFIVTAPSPIGVGQSCNVVFFNPQVPPGDAGPTAPARYYYTLTVTKPDTTSQTWPTSSPAGYSAWGQNAVGTINGQSVFVSDTTGSTYTTLVPDQVGNWTITVHFLKLQFLWNTTLGISTNDYYGTTFKASDYTVTLVVQQQPVSLTGLTAPTYPPVPEAFWTRPIEQQNTLWYAIASNYLRTSHDYNNGGGQNSFQPDGTAPNSGHILWTMPTEDSGIVGGSDTTRAGNTYDTGAQYQPRFTSPLIMYGRLYFSPNLYSSGSSEMYTCVDLKTGQVLWNMNTTAFNNVAASTFGLAIGTSGTANVPAFGYLYSEDNPNQHGIDNPGWLFTQNYGLGYQAALGIPYLHIANVPTSAGYFPDLTDPTGAQIRFVMQNTGTPTAPAYSNLLQWNSSRVVPGIANGNSLTQSIIQGNVPISPAPTLSGVPTAAYTWNGTQLLSLSTSGPGSIPATFRASGSTSTTTVTYSVYWNGAAWVNVTSQSPLNSVFQYNQWVPTPVTTSSLSLAGYTSTGATSYDWNTTLTYNGQPFKFVNSPSIYAGSLNRDVVWGYNGTWPQFSGAPSYAFPDNITVWEIGTGSNNMGQVLYLKALQIDDVTKNTNYIFEHADADAGANGIFVALEEPDMIFHVYDMSTGNQLWQSDAQAQSISPYNYYTWSSLLSQTQTKFAYGFFYTGGYGGTISAYNITTGALVWRNNIIPTGAAGNLKSSPAIMGLIADGKIYVGSHEHSAETPLEAGNQVKCLNATTGEYIWKMAGWMYPYSVAEADGVLIYWNDYDAQVYAVGQGPSSMTLSAPQVGVTTATPVTIRGTIMDVSAGTQQTAIKADWPNGLPVVSDASMSQWMEYVYMQKLKPDNATGVPVSIDVVDANGNYRHIGTTTSDVYGTFSYTWTPDIPGDYTVVATFSGSNSYYGTSADTTFHAATPPATPAPTATTAVSTMTDTYVLGGVIAIIIVIIIVGAILAMMVRKRP